MQWVDLTNNARKVISAVDVQEASGSAKVLAEFLTFVNTCVPLFDNLSPVRRRLFDSGRPEIKPLCAAAESIYKLLMRLTHVQRSRALISWMSGDLKDQDYKAFFPKDLYPVAHATQIEWDKELETIENSSEITTFTAKLDIFQSAVGVKASGTLMKSMAFEEMSNHVTAFLDKFPHNFQALINQRAETLGMPFHNYIQKYDACLPAIEAWTLKDVEWVFQPQYTQEINKDIEQSHEGRKQVDEFFKQLEPVEKHPAAISHLPDIVQSAAKHRATLEEQVKKFCVITSCNLYASQVIEPKSTKGDYEFAEKYSFKKLRLTGHDHLPDKLKKMVKDAIAKLSKAADDKDKKNSKDKKDKKDKDKSEKTEKRKSISDDPSAKKEKSEKPSKSRKK